MTIAVVTDSAANVPSDLVERYGITVVPMTLKFGDRELRDGIDLPEGGFYKALVEEKVSVSTSAPSQGDFRAAFEQALARADGVVCVTVASFVSVTYESALGAAKELGERVQVVDSRSASLGEGFAAIEAARAASEGADLEAVAARADEVAHQTSFVATIDTFEFLRRSGRVNMMLAYAGTALNIKPVFAFRRGKIEQLGRPRTRRRAIERLVAEARDAAASGPLHLGVAHADCPDDAQELMRMLQEVPHSELLLSQFTPLMGSHTGPGVLGVAFFQ